SFKSTDTDTDQVKLQARLYVASSPMLPVKLVKVGDKWDHDYKANSDMGLRAAHADFEVVGDEKVNGIHCFKIKMTYKETENKPLSCAGVWAVEKTSGDMVTADYQITNLVFSDNGPVADGKIHEERVAGSPMGGVKPADSKPEPKKEKTID